MRLRTVVAEAWRSLTASLSTTLAAALTVLIGMFLVGLLIAFWTFADSWSNKQKEKLVVKVFFCTPEHLLLASGGGDGESDQRRAREAGRRFPGQELSVRLEERGARDHEEGAARDGRQLISNPLPNSFTVTPVKGEYTRAIAETFTPPPAGVEKATYGEKTASRVLKAARVIKGSFLLAGLILIIASAMLIANTIRLSIFARRREIEVMKLVGASNWFVRGPFVLEGIICGLVGSVLAVLLLVLGKELALPQIVPQVRRG